MKSLALVSTKVADAVPAIDAGITTFDQEFRQFEDAEALLGSGEGNGS